MKTQFIAARLAAAFLALSAVACGGVQEESSESTASLSEVQQQLTEKERLDYTQAQHQQHPSYIPGEPASYGCTTVPNRCCSNTMFCCVWTSDAETPTCGYQM